jgi:hypothetical protein
MNSQSAYRSHDIAGPISPRKTYAISQFLTQFL